MSASALPRLLVIDDLFGRSQRDRPNAERANLCGQLLLEDVTGDHEPGRVSQRIKQPIAQAVFVRGQTPAAATVGDVVENDLGAALQAIRQGWTQRPPRTPPWAALLLDLCFFTGPVTAESNRRMVGMPEGRPGDSVAEHYFGLHVLQAVRDEFPSLPVVILSSTPREQVSRELSRLGALGFIARGEPDSRERLREYLGRHGLLPDPDGQLVGYSVTWLMALRSGRRAAATGRSVLIRGEAGSGKELLAAYLHRFTSGRADRPFVAVDSGALSPELFLSELFGHARGAFTGATEDRVGRIAQADGGDLFLDEIGNMPANVQGAILRVLQDRVVVPVGAREGRQVDTRFLSATNADVEGQSLLGQFRADLLDRLREGGTVALPSLRERREDIPLLVDAFLEAARKADPTILVREVSREAMDLLCANDWPGNVRALGARVRQAIASHPDVEHLYPAHFELPGAPRAPVPADAARRAQRPLDTRELTTAASRSTHGETASLDEVLATVERFQAAGQGPREIAGALPKVERTFARLLAGLLTSALDATARRTPENPDGRPQIHPAMKLLSGDSSLSAAKAADIVKRLCGISPGSIDDMSRRAPLKDALEKALRLRPRNARPNGTRK